VCSFILLHDLNHLDLDPAAAGIHMVVSGHTHRPHLYAKDGVAYLNPGSAGHRRSTAPVSVAIVHIDGGKATPRIIEIDC
jgi:predicted phosphodiesterase